MCHDSDDRRRRAHRRARQSRADQDEKQLFTKQLADILAYAEQVQAVDTTGVAGTAHVNAHGDRARPTSPAVA